MLQFMIDSWDDETKFHKLCIVYNIDKALGVDAKKERLIALVNQRNKRPLFYALILRVLLCPIAFLLFPAPFVITSIMLFVVKFVMEKDITYEAGYLIKDMIANQKKQSILFNNAVISDENTEKQFSKTELDFITTHWNCYKSLDNKVYQSKKYLIIDCAVNVIMFGVSCLFPITPLLVIAQSYLVCFTISDLYQ